MNTISLYVFEGVAKKIKKIFKLILFMIIKQINVIIIKRKIGLNHIQNKIYILFYIYI